MQGTAGVKSERVNEGQKFSGSMELNKCHLQEHEPLSHLLDILPHKAQKGLTSLPVDYTCIDVSPEYIALGSNVGIIFLYDRLGQTLQRLNCNVRTEVISCIRMAESVDYVIAVGTLSGNIFVFQLPSILPGRAKQLRLYYVSEIHYGKVTCVEWSQNTMKLFSGDINGKVACTEMDYSQRHSQSYAIAEEPHEIVQLDYSFKTLLVSTKFRSFLCSPDESYKKHKLGTKDRKILGSFGACFKPELCRAEDATLFATRPGLRLWCVNMEGKVKSTYMFKDLLNESTPIIVLLPDTICDHPFLIEEKSFGLIKIYALNQLVTWNEGSLFVINPKDGKFIGWNGNLGTIQDLAVCNEEIYILRSGPGRKIIRIAQKRDLLNEPVKAAGIQTTSMVMNKSIASPVNILQQTASTLADAIIGVSEKIKTVQEGQPPAWGMVTDPANVPQSPDVDSCREVNSQSSSSSTVSTPLHEQFKLPQSPDALRIVVPVSKDSAKTESQPKISVNSNVDQRTSSTDCNNSFSSSSKFGLSKIKPDRPNIVNVLSQRGDDDIVFTPKHRKGKKKRPKSKKKKVPTATLR